MSLRDHYFDADGRPLSPERLADWTIMVEGGFTTAEVEARRMVKDRDPVIAKMGADWLAEHAA